MDDNMIMVPVRMPPALLAAVDQTVAILGGNRSQFVRMAVSDRLDKLTSLSGLEYRADGPSLSPTDENEVPND